VVVKPRLAGRRPAINRPMSRVWIILKRRMVRIGGSRGGIIEAVKAKILNIIILIVGGLIIFNLASNIIHLWQKGGRLTEENLQLEELRARNSELETQLEYVQSEEFIEKKARENLGLAKQGEEVWILPPISVNSPEDNTPIPNWRQWWELFF